MRTPEQARLYARTYYHKNKEEILKKAKEAYRNKKQIIKEADIKNRRLFREHHVLTQKNFGGIISDNGDGSFNITEGIVCIKKPGFFKRLLKKIFSK